LGSLVSQMGVAPVHPIGWPSSVEEQGRQSFSVPLQMGGSGVPALTSKVHTRRPRLLARIQAPA
jgi:hypothetical protein